MEPRAIINSFLKTHCPEEELRDALFNAASAAHDLGWTFMDASFQLGEKAREDGLDKEEAEAILRRAFSKERRRIERRDSAEPGAPVAPARTESSDALDLDAESRELLQSRRIDPEALSIPWPTDDWRKDLVKLLQSAFQPDETIDFKITNTPKASREKVSTIVEQSDSINKIMRSLDGPDGALLAINASSGGENAKDESWRYRYAVIDSARMTLSKQLAYYKALNLPCAALINTGANSVQAWVRIEATDSAEYAERVEFLYSTLEEHGFRADPANKSPIHMVRMPGVLRQGKQQYLIGLAQGAKGWNEWKEWVNYCLDGKPLIELASYHDQPPAMDSKIVEDILRAGQFLLFSAPPKSGKSLALLDLALSVCHGTEWLGFATTRADALLVNFDLTKTALINRLHLIGTSKNLPANTNKLGVLNLRGTNLAPIEMAHLIVKRIQGARKLEDHDYRLVVLDPISAVLHALRTSRNSADVHQIILQMVDIIVAGTGAAVIGALSENEIPHLQLHSDGLLQLTPVEERPGTFQMSGQFREFPTLTARECSWRYPRFVV